jgi:uracil-DNA glycosylase family protein
VGRSDAVRSQPARALSVVAEQAASCERCDLYRNATQTVFGEGPVPAPLMLVGEQPGDHEDKAGHPFVGPAGRLLDEAFDAASIDRHNIYVTNAVKHFKWEPRGKRRIHQKPNASEVAACEHWLDQEVELVDPRVLVALGATALRPLFTERSTVSALRGAPRESRFGVPAVVTVHPSAIVRIRERDERRTAFDAFVGDLRLAASTAAQAV